MSTGDINHVPFLQVFSVLGRHGQVNKQLSPDVISSVIELGAMCYREGFPEEGIFS